LGTSRRWGSEGGRDLKKVDVKTVRTVVAALLVALGLVLGAIALLGGDSDEDSSEGSTATNAVALSESELLARVGELGQPAFWVGPRAGTESYELSSASDGRVYVRYLTDGAEAGDPRPEFLTVGTYPVADASEALQTRASGENASYELSQHDGYEALTADAQTNAYVVFDDQPTLQIEVYSPVPGEAADLANSGALKPVG
jgi:hypothetical protein